MGSSSVRYQYALNEEGNIKDINELSEKDRKDYECLGCGNILRPVLAKERKRHFRHKVNSDCSLETYLHRMGKKLFIEKYEECQKQGIPYTIEYERPVVCNFCKHGPCKQGNDRGTYDLTKWFTSISEEERDDNKLIPDVLLQTETGEKIYIEIAVTHRSSTKKINSGVRVIEFILTEEEDLKIFTQTKISFLQDSIEIFNFKPSSIKRNLKSECYKKVRYFMVLANGKCKINTVAIYKFDKIQNNPKKYISKIPYPSSDLSDFFVEEAEKAFLKGVKVKNCFLCRYHAINTSPKFSEETRPIFCKFYNSAKNSNMAAECEIYRPDKKVFRYSKV